MADKFEAVQKVTETLSKQGRAEEMEKMSPNKDQFDSLMASTKNIKEPSFERIDSKAYSTDEVQSTEKNPVFADENVSSQKSGSATDQDQKRRHKQESDDEIEEVKSTRSSGSKSRSASLMDEVTKLNSNVNEVAGGSPEKIKAHAKETINLIEEMKEKLSQAQGEIKPSYQTVLRNRLSHIDDNLKIALNKAGVEYTPAQAVHAAEAKSPIHRFINYLAHSQEQLNNLNKTMDDIANIKDLTPGRMLALQAKMASVQQQMELFSSLLNKALESTKTVMNVQV